jgi:predicted  nucleic acid-binding Zn-ribbon protein
MGEPTRQKSNIGHRIGRVEAVKAKLDVAKELLSHRERFLLSVQKAVARARREVEGLESRLGYEEAKLADIKRQALHLHRKRVAAADRKREADNAAAVRAKAATPKV